MFYVRKAAIIGRNCERLVEHLLMTDEYRGILRVRGIFHLSNSIDKTVLEEACGEAFRFKMLRMTQIKSLCLSILANRSNVVTPALTQHHEYIRGVAEYQTHFDERVTK